MKIKIIKGIPRLIVAGVVINNWVKVYREFNLPSKPINFFQDLILLLRGKQNIHSLNHNFEAGVYLSHLRVTKPDDKILAVGLGIGATLIPIVKFIGASKGFYRCIEASDYQIRIALKNIELNNIDDSKFEIINAFAGNNSYDTWGKSSAKNLDINIYEFDILEMDCEGSELSILQSLIKTPRNIIVELHPVHFPLKFKDFDNLLKLLEEKGYEYQFAYGHSGDFLDINAARYSYNSTNTTGNIYACNEDRSKQFFMVCPIVVTFTYKGHLI